MERHKPQTPLRFLHGSKHPHAYLGVWRTSAHNNMNEYMHCLALCSSWFSMYFQWLFKVSSLQYNRWLTMLSAWARLWACIPWCLLRSRSGTWVHGVAVCMSLNGSPSLIVGAHAPMTGYVSVVHLRWPCVPWRYEPMTTFGQWWPYWERKHKG